MLGLNVSEAASSGSTPTSPAVTARSPETSEDPKSTTPSFEWKLWRRARACLGILLTLAGFRV